MPNWKKPAEYEFADHLTPRGWAWEFLRRNPKYRLAWVQLLIDLALLIDNHGPFIEWVKHPQVLKSEPDAWEHHPLFGTRELVPVARGREWCLECMVDPDAAEARFLDMPFQPPVWTKTFSVPQFIGGVEKESLRGAYTWIRLDLPIDPQVDSLRKNLKKKQKDLNVALPPKKVTRAQQTRYKGYLRVLDGREAGVSYHTIALALASETKNRLNKDDPDMTIKDWVKAAKKMVKEGWISLLSK